MIKKLLYFAKESIPFSFLYGASFVAGFDACFGACLPTLFLGLGAVVFSWSCNLDFFAGGPHTEFSSSPLVSVSIASLVPVRKDNVMLYYHIAGNFMGC